MKLSDHPTVKAYREKSIAPELPDTQSIVDEGFQTLLSIIKGNGLFEVISP